MKLATNSDNKKKKENNNNKLNSIFLPISTSNVRAQKFLTFRFEPCLLVLIEPQLHDMINSKFT